MEKSKTTINKNKPTYPYDFWHQWKGQPIMSKVQIDAFYNLTKVIDALQSSMTENPLKLSRIEMIELLEISRETLYRLIDALTKERDVFSQSINAMATNLPKYKKMVLRDA
jgi:hypothetical protein